MAELAKNAVDSVLGTIGAAIGDEARRLGSVRRDMQFIKDEMESMNGFLLDVADPADQSNQVRAWMKQVREVAYHSQSCIDRYVQSVGAGRSSAGLLGYVRRVPRAVLTVRDRYHIANQIREIRSRAQEVGERRQRYGVQALAPTQGAARLAQEAEEDDAGRRHALADALRLLDTDEPEVMAWLTGGGDLDAGPRMPLKEILSKFLNNMFTSEDLQLELATTARQVLYNKDPDNVEDADAIISEQGTKITEMQQRVLLAAMKKILGLHGLGLGHDNGGATSTGKENKPESHKDGTSDEKKEDAAAAAAGVSDALELMKTASNRAEFEEAERQYSTQLTDWLKRVFSDELIEELVLCNDWLRDVLLVATATAGAAAEILVGATKVVTDMVADLKSRGKSTMVAVEHKVGEYWQALLHDNQTDHVSAPAQGSGSGTQAHETPAENSNHSFKDILSGISQNKLLPKAIRKVAERLIKDLAWLDKITSHSLSSRDTLGPRLLAIVAPPADVPSPEDGEHPATKIAERVCTICREAHQFDRVIWIDAGLNKTPIERLQCLLHEVMGPLADDDQPLGQQDNMRSATNESSEEDIRKSLGKKIQKHLKDKTFLIVLANHEDETPWKDIEFALPKGKPENTNTIIVTPVIHHPLHFHGWYIASWLFVLKASRYKVHFYSHIEALSKKANGLLVDGHKSKELHSVVKNILKKCRWDENENELVDGHKSKDGHKAFSSELFLRALYANPRRSENELVTLEHELEEFSTHRNNTAMIRFCYRDLPAQYQTWLKCLSMFYKEKDGGTTKIRRGSLLRRWAAENQITSRGALAEAERCLNALVDRGLVLFSDSDCGPDGKPKYCELHRHVLTFITEKFPLEDGVWETGLPKNVAHRLTVGNGVQLQPVSSRRHATCFSMFWRRLILSRTTTPTPQPPTDSSAALDEAIVFLNSLPASLQLGFIKVLDLEDCCGLDEHNLRNICNKIYQLKYLSLRKTQIAKLPSEIDKLQVLETLDVRETEITSFPANINQLQKLMHLLAGKVHHRTSSTDQESLCTVPIPGEIRSMTNVQVLSHVKVSASSNLVGVGDLHQLRKLGVVVVPCEEGAIIKTLLQEIGKLDECLCSLAVYIAPATGNSEAGVDMNSSEAVLHPRSLQSLNINGKISGLLDWIKKLHRLSRITLCRTYLTDQDIEFLGVLVNLRTLVLRHGSCQLEKLVFKKNEFRQLELLVVQGSKITNIHFAAFAAPKLEKVVWEYEPEPKLVAERMVEGTSEPTILEARMDGINKLPSLKHIELTGKFRKQMHENRNHPVLKEK